MDVHDYMSRLGDLLAVTEIIIKERDDARRERDEARREVLNAMHPDLRNFYADAREWDCFTEREEADYNNHQCRTTDGE
jgi:hypothetical protein